MLFAVCLARCIITLLGTEKNRYQLDKFELKCTAMNKARTKLLFECVKSKSVLALKDIIEQFSDAASWKDKHGDTALHVAMWNCNEEATILLCSAGANMRETSTTCIFLLNPV